ncbi:hypothetical protein GCM10010517_09490 [Streptosporangium fragile]|uniref:DUF3043 domain-containing protein n=1 Tax=Streptosporangium fragile TaxID=46186 RepID=A0ABN3VS76_9ACTN
MTRRERRRLRKHPPPPLNTSLQDVCSHQEMCLAHYIREKGGMPLHLSNLFAGWAGYAALSAQCFQWPGPLMLVVFPGEALLVIFFGLVVYRNEGHRGWCRILRSLDLANVFSPRKLASSFLRCLRTRGQAPGGTAGDK